MPRWQDDGTEEDRRREPEHEVRRDTAAEDEDERAHREEHEGGIGEGPLT
jgi:hypothetical protein